MKIIGFIKWRLAKVSLFTVFFFWSISTVLCVFEPAEVAKYHMAIWVIGMISLLLIVIAQQIRSSYYRYLKEQQELLNMLNDDPEWKPGDKWRIDS